MATDVRDLVLAIHADSAETARRWHELSPTPPACFDETFLFHLYSHHVGALAYDAADVLGWRSMFPPFLQTVLSRSGGLSEAVWEAHYAGLVELAERDPKLIAQCLVVKGALLGTMYQSKEHRVMGDFDLIIAADKLDMLLNLLRESGYDRRSDMAYDMQRDIGPSFTGAGLTSMHVWEMPKGWECHVSTGKVGTVECLLPTPELHIIELLLNAHEHASSWNYALWESDLQLVRAIDIEVIWEAAGGVDPLRLWETAVDVGLEAETALGLWVHEQLRGSLPANWSPLRVVIDAVAPFGDLYALPESVDTDEPIRRWPLSVRERAFHPSRHQLALDQLPEHQHTVEFIADIKAGRVSRRQPTSRIADRARAALSGISPSV
ncbi:nucleotidyltransferase family protein [Nonomuraea sp. NPDC050451]|uniref:nucleotidyltransferase family protein n=1 Tax=Nonomuraea sp. NPDC050451 TaxID=3364364 RepID=UPI00378B7F9E